MLELRSSPRQSRTAAAAISILVRINRPHLNGTPTPRWNPCRQFNRFVQVAGFHQVVSAELFFCLREWPVCDIFLPITNPYRGGGGSGLEFIAADVLAGFAQVFAQRHIFAVNVLFFAFLQSVPVAFNP